MSPLLLDNRHAKKPRRRIPVGQVAAAIVVILLGVVMLVVLVFNNPAGDVRP